MVMSRYETETVKIVVTLPVWLKDYVVEFCKFNHISVSQLTRLFYSELQVEFPDLPLSSKIKKWRGRIFELLGNNGNRQEKDAHQGYYLKGR